jgi:hypothetical protein
MNPENKTETQILKQELESLRSAFYLNNFAGGQDVNKYTRYNYRLKVPSYSVEPTTCEVGEIIEVSGKLKICSASNTWTVVGTQV